jgi:hypothetical protein
MQAKYLFVCVSIVRTSIMKNKPSDKFLGVASLSFLLSQAAASVVHPVFAATALLLALSAGVLPLLQPDALQQIDCVPQLDSSTANNGLCCTYRIAVMESNPVLNFLLPTLCILSSRKCVCHTNLENILLSLC